MLNNSLVADSWVSKSVCNLTLTTSTVETTLSSSSGQPRTPWEWINKYKQRMFFKLLCIWSTGHFSSSETKARFQTMTSSSLHLLPFLMIPVHSTALFLSIGKRFFIMCCHFQRISQYAIGYFIFENFCWNVFFAASGSPPQQYPGFSWGCSWQVVAAGRFPVWEVTRADRACSVPAGLGAWQLSELA